MLERISTYPTVAKILRIILTFSLVFTGSFALEQIALAAEVPSLYESAPTNGRIKEVTVYQVTDGNNFSIVSSTNSASKPGVVSISDRQGEAILFPVITWEEIDEEGNIVSTTGGTAWRTVATKYVDWKVSGDIGSMSQEGDYQRFKAAGTSDGMMNVEYLLKSSVSTDLMSSSLKSTNLFVGVNLTNQSETPKPEEPVTKKDPFITSIEILQADGSSFTESRSLEMSVGDTYDFQARVAIKDPEVEGEGAAQVVICTPTKSLSQAISEAGITFTSGYTFKDSDLVWGTEGTGGEIDGKGHLNVTDESNFLVRCTTTKGEEGQQPPADTIAITVGEKEKEKPYVSRVEILKEDGSAFADDETLNLGQGGTQDTTSSDDGSSATSSEQSSGDQASSDSSGDNATRAATYQFHVRVTMHDPENETDTIYTHTKDGWTQEGSTDALNELPFALTWEVNGSDTAEITQDGLLAVTGKDELVVRCLTTNGKDNSLVDDTVRVNGTSSEDNPDTSPKVELLYTPAEKGQSSTLTAQPANVEPDTFSLAWEESTDEGTTWTPTGQTGGTISVLTDDEHLGRQYRVAMTVDGIDEPIYSNVVTIIEGDGDNDGADGKPYVRITYRPVPKGEKAVLVSSPENVGAISYYNTWEESTDGGQTWNEIPPYDSQTLYVMTDDEHIGRMYRARVDVISPDTYSITSRAITIIEGEPQFSVFVDVTYPKMGEIATFTTDVRNIPDGTPEELTYVWEISTNGGGKRGTWSELSSGYLPTYSVTADSSVLSNHYRVRVRTKSGSETISYDQMLAVVDETEGQDEQDPSAPQDITPIPPSDDTPTPSPSPDEPITPPDDSTPQDPQQDPTDQPQDQPQDQQQPQQEQNPETMSQMVDRYGEMNFSYNDGSTATMKPLENTPTETDEQVNENIENAINVTPEMETTPGVRLRELYMQEEKPDIHKILQNNLFGQLLIPLVLAVVAAGALEKYLRYREQRRPSLAAF